MNASEVLAKIHIPAADRYVSVRPVEAEFLHRWVKEHGLSRTLEVGLAYGVLAACIMAAHEGLHTCMDPYQNDFGGQGLANLDSLGFGSRVEFHPHPSREALPRLAAAGRTFDFAFIDGDHRYDAIFVDFFYVDLLLGQQGYVLFHDAWMRGTQLVASFVQRNRSDYRRVRCPIRNMILFQKQGHDKRPWHHFREFYTWRAFASHRAILWMLRFFKKLPPRDQSENAIGEEGRPLSRMDGGG